MQKLKQQYSVKSYPLSLTQTVIFTLVTTILAVLLTMYVFLYYEGNAFFDELSASVLSAKKVKIEEAIHDYIDAPAQSNAILLHAVGREAGDTFPVRNLIGEMVNTLCNVFTHQQYLNQVRFGGVNGDFVQVAHGKAQVHEHYLTLRDAGTHHQLTTYSRLNLSSSVKAILPDYQINQQDWFSAVVRDQMPHWTAAFRDDRYDDEIGVTFSSPAFNRQGKFVGVVASEIRLNELNRHLEKFKPSPESILLIVNEKNRLISSSIPALMHAMLAGEPHSPLQLPTLQQTAVPAIMAADNALRHQTHQGLLSFKIGNAVFYVRAFPITDRDSLLHWQGIVISPASNLTHTIVKYLLMTMGMLFIVFFLGLLVVFWGLSRVTKPLQDIVRKADTLATYRWAPPANKRHFPEIASLETTFMALSHKLADSFDAQRREIEEDPSTGLLTRRGLLRQTSLYQRRNLLALLHISNMNAIINSLSAEYGEKFMGEFIHRLSTLLPTNTLIARDSVDKLIVVFPGQTQRKDHQRYCNLLSALFTDAEYAAQFTVSTYIYTGNAGLVWADLCEGSIEKTLREAWIALRYAQKQGNGIAMFFAREMHVAERDNIQLHEHLNDAFQRKEFSLQLQPIVDLHEVSLFAEGECLLCWRSEIVGEIPAERFIPLAEESGLIIPLGRWFIEEACRELAAMIVRGAPANFMLHIKISPAQLLQQDFAWHLLDAIRRNGLVAGNICLGLTERFLMNDVARVIRVVGYLRRHDISVALDGFGVNTSGWSLLHRLSFDYIKIDHRLISQNIDEDKAELIIGSLVALAQSFAVPLIVGGIEGEREKQQLCALGCQKVQGDYFGRSAPFPLYPVNSRIAGSDRQKLANEADRDRNRQ